MPIVEITLEHKDLALGQRGGWHDNCPITRAIRRVVKPLTVVCVSECGITLNGQYVTPKWLLEQKFDDPIFRWIRRYDQTNHNYGASDLLPFSFSLEVPSELIPSPEGSSKQKTFPA